MILARDNDVAAAESPRDPVAGEALFREGRRLLKAGDVAGACLKLGESHRLDPAPGTLANLAECEERQGHTASAWQHWRRFAEEVPAGDARRATALARSEALEKQLARLSLEPAPDAPADLVVERDGVLFLPPSYGLALPADPGAHTVVARAPGRAPRRYELLLTPGQSQQLVVTAGPPLAAAPAAAAPAAPTADLTTRTPAPRSRIGAIAITSVGAAALGAGVFFGLRAMAARRDADRACAPGSSQRPGVCWDRGYDALARDATYSRLADVGFVTGGVALGVGAFLLLRNPAHESRGRVAVGVGPTAGGGEVQLAGRF